jgi:hypothetical protein
MQFSYQPFEPGKAALEKNGLNNLRFIMGKAKIDEPNIPEE